MFRSIPGGDDDDDDEDGDDMDEGDGEDVGDVFRKVFVDFRCDFFCGGKREEEKRKDHRYNGGNLAGFGDS